MPLDPTAKLKFRQELARYGLVALKYNAVWHYSQTRPATGYHLAPSATHYLDCSSGTSVSFYNAGVWSGHPVRDPCDMHYSGYGNTETIHEWLKDEHAPPDKYRVGDIALYLNGPFYHHHVVWCIEEGDGSTSRWWSNGSEAGPNKVMLHYRSDLTGVYRHPALQ